MGTGTIAILYQCWLTKVVCSNDVFATTNVEHEVTYWVKPTLPTAGTSNYWNDQGLGLTEDAWSAGSTSAWSFDINNPALFGGEVSTEPAATVTPTEVNKPNCTGFKCTDFNAIMDWRFQYCTNAFW